MVKESYKKLLEKQQYEFIGNHSAVKICTWTKKSLRNEGVCYKEQFYGIKSHRCCQLSVTVNYCDMDCVYCWRDHYNEPFTDIDNPKELISKAIEAQRKLLSGFGGLDKVNKEKFQQAQDPNQFAISLTGETLYYPHLSEFIKEIKQHGGSSFVVTNGMLPDIIQNLEPPTQLYLSIDSPNKELQEQICKPLHKDSWERLLKSLDILKTLKPKTRTCLRITLIKDMNMIKPENYAKLISSAEPHFVEVKAYMFVGASRLKLLMENMPLHEDIKGFAAEIAKHCGYRLIDEHPASRVVLLMKQDFPERIMKF
ncbi:4-demethylwyosine synthase TYW1 [Candidatus Woesearchaeota archaeon]|nr:4-demethylwyosine synthase TYW1 [Candidatus Woesearchaeota archaeon]